MTKDQIENTHHVLGILFPPTIPEEWATANDGWALYNLYRNNEDKLDMMRHGAHYDWNDLNHCTDTSYLRKEK